MSTSSTNNDVQIIEPHPDCRDLVEVIASLVAEQGLEMEKRIRESSLRDGDFNFLKSSHPYHAFYQQKVIEYREAPPNQEPCAPINTGQRPPSRFTFELEPPHWITLKEDAIMKLTAQSVTRYDLSFFDALIDKEHSNPHLGFIRCGDPRSHYFIHLVDAYMDVRRPRETDGASPETLVNGFLEKLQILLEKDDDGVEMAMSDLDAVVGCVDHMEDQESFDNVPLPDHLLMGMLQLHHHEGEPKTQ